jgi:choline dehydrogenase-like flavoprotein
LASAAGFHFLGTARMGNDPKTSVTDAECRAHEMPNLVVPDGSVFVTAGAVNPTSTIQAIALRAADALATRLRARPA